MKPVWRIFVNFSLFAKSEAVFTVLWQIGDGSYGRMPGRENNICQPLPVRIAVMYERINKRNQLKVVQNLEKKQYERFD